MRLALGTVQFGMNYGVTNDAGHVSEAAVRNILDAACNSGVKILDTAALYGNSETVLGLCGAGRFSVVSKTPRFDTINTQSIDILQQSAKDSLQKLRITKLYGLLAHHAPNLLGTRGELLWNAMRELRSEGLSEKIGASVYSGSEIDQLLERYEDIDLVQLPLNVLDQRLIAGGQIAQLVARGVEIHVRSIFLQGLLLQPVDKVPLHLSELNPWLSRWHAAVSSADITAMAAAFGFIKAAVGTGTVLVGVTSMREFSEVQEAFDCAIAFDATDLACNEVALIDPSHWSRN